jgi:hypothetical protein
MNNKNEQQELRDLQILFEGLRSNEESTQRVSAQNLSIFVRNSFLTLDGQCPK